MPLNNDWKLSEAEGRLAKLRLQYEGAATIVSARKSAQARVWRCWTKAHADNIAPDGGQLVEPKEMAEANKEVAAIFDSVRYQR